MTMNRNPRLPPSFPDFLCYYNQQESIKRKDSSNPSSSRKLHNQPKKKKKVQSPLVRKASACAPSERPVSLSSHYSLSLSLSLSLSRFVCSHQCCDIILNFLRTTGSDSFHSPIKELSVAVVSTTLNSLQIL
jgi:hypothetical protein